MEGVAPSVYNLLEYFYNELTKTVDACRIVALQYVADITRWWRHTLLCIEALLSPI